MSLDNTLLAIRREFSKDEKYKIFLRHLDNIEIELQKERKQNTELLKQNQSLKSLVEELECELSEYSNNNAKKNFVRLKTHERLQKDRTAWKERFWEQNTELNELKNTLTKKNLNEATNFTESYKNS